MLAWHLLSEFAIQLCNPSVAQDEMVWDRVEELLRQARLCEVWGIFLLPNLQEPWKFTAKVGYHWHAVGKNQGEFCSILDKIWKVSFPVGKKYIFHCESKSAFGKTAQDFLSLLASLLHLRFLHIPISNTTSFAESIAEIAKNNSPQVISTSENHQHNPSPAPINPLETHTSQQNSATSSPSSRYPEIIGQCPQLLEIFQLVDKVATSHIPILIQGESGTGKELIAKAVHTHSPRSQFPFISENCAAIPETLLESELFGYSKGAFTGAVGNKPGLFELADRGTLFLDEVGDMSLAMQKKLLRAVQNGEIRRVGGKEIQQVDVRLITATNKNLQEAMKNGLFREDLYFRLNVVNVVLPPLRERGQDIWLLFQHLTRTNAQQMNMPIPHISEKVQDYLLKYAWPGNIRELQNEVKRILALLEGEEILPQHLSPAILHPPSPKQPGKAKS